MVAPTCSSSAWNGQAQCSHARMCTMYVRYGSQGYEVSEYCQYVMQGPRWRQLCLARSTMQRAG